MMVVMIAFDDDDDGTKCKHCLVHICYTISHSTVAAQHFVHLHRAYVCTTNSSSNGSLLSRRRESSALLRHSVAGRLFRTEASLFLIS